MFHASCVVGEWAVLLKIFIISSNIHGSNRMEPEALRHTCECVSVHVHVYACVFEDANVCAYTYMYHNYVQFCGSFQSV